MILADSSLYRDVGSRARNSLTKALEDYAHHRTLQTGQTPVLPGEFLDLKGSLGGQHGLTALLLWPVLADRVGAATDNTGVLKAAANLTAHVTKAIGSIAAGQQDSAVTPGRPVDWAKLITEFSDSTTKRCLHVVGLAAQKIEDELRFLCRNTCVSGQLRGWRSKLEPHSVGEYDILITAYVLSCMCDGLERHPDATPPQDQEVLSVISSCCQALWLEAHKHHSSPYVNNDILETLFILVTLYRAASLKLIQQEHSSLELGRIHKSIKRIIILVFTSSQFDPLFIGSEITHFFTDLSVDVDRYIRINADTVLLDAIIISHGASDYMLKRQEVCGLISRVSFALQDRFTTDANGQRLTIYAAYHSMRSIDRLETERKNVRHKIWTASLARLVYWWDFRRSFFVDLMWTFGSLALAGAAAAEPVVQFATVPLLVLAATSLIRAFTMAHRRQ